MNSNIHLQHKTDKVKGWQEGVRTPYTQNALNDSKLSPGDRSVGILRGFREEGSTGMTQQEVEELFETMKGMTKRNE